MFTFLVVHFKQSSQLKVCVNYIDKELITDNDQLQQLQVLCTRTHQILEYLRLHSTQLWPLLVVAQLSFILVMDLTLMTPLWALEPIPDPHYSRLELRCIVLDYIINNSLNSCLNRIFPLIHTHLRIMRILTLMAPLFHQTMKVLQLRMFLSHLLLHLGPSSWKVELHQQAVERLTLVLIPLPSSKLMVIRGNVHSACKLLNLFLHFL